MLAALTDLSMVSYIQHLNAVLAECAPRRLSPTTGGRESKRMADALC